MVSYHRNDRDLLFKGWYQLAIAHPELNGILDLQQQHGVPVNELSSLLDKLKGRQLCCQRLHGR